MRWYEQNPELSELLNFIETLDIEDRNTVAHHLLQILISECGVNLDNEISGIADRDYSYNRWYDDIFDLSTAMEFMKQLPENKQEYALKRFLSEIVMSYVKKEI
ncbi:hypothetical protein IJ707_02175 [bacterium]|nr:hypothetical protein [bacterium]